MDQYTMRLKSSDAAVKELCKNNMNTLYGKMS